VRVCGVDRLRPACGLRVHSSRATTFGSAQPPKIRALPTRSGSSVSLTDATRLEDIRGPLITPPEGDTAVVRRWVREFASATGMADLLYEFDKLLARGAGNADQQLITTLAIACEKPE